MTNLKPTCENCRTVNWKDKNKNGYLCTITRKRIHPTSMAFNSCELYNIKHTSWFSLLSNFKKLCHTLKKPFSLFSLLNKKANSIYSNNLRNITKRICAKKLENFTPSFPHSCYSCKLIDWSDVNRHGFLCKLWNRRSQQKTYMNTHCCRYYNTKRVWLTKLIIKLKKQKKRSFKNNFHKVVAFTKGFTEKNYLMDQTFKKKPVWDYRSEADKNYVEQKEGAS